MTVAIEIPDEIGQARAAQAGGVSRAILEAVAAGAYRPGLITTAQVQQMLALRSRWETESFLRRAEAFHDYTMDDLAQDTSPICYLVLIGEIDLLPRLFSQVLAPHAVLAELLHEDAPIAVREWASKPPSWLRAKEVPL